MTILHSALSSKVDQVKHTSVKPFRFGTADPQGICPGAYGLTSPPRLRVPTTIKTTHSRKFRRVHMLESSGRRRVRTDDDESPKAHAMATMPMVCIAPCRRTHVQLYNYFSRNVVNVSDNLRSRYPAGATPILRWYPIERNRREILLPSVVVLPQQVTI